MSWLSSFLHPGRAYDKAGQAQQAQMDKYYGQAQNYFNQGQQYLQPFMQQGQQAYGNLSGAMNQLLDPQALQDKWASGYKESEAAKQAEGMAQEHGLDAASGLGLMGSGTALNAIQAGTSQIGAQDRQQYLNDLMQKYLAGAGLAQNIYGTGAQSAGQLGQQANQFGQSVMGMGQNQAQNAAQMAYGQQSAGGNMLGGLIGSGIGLLGSALGGGWKPWSTGGS